MPVHLTDRSKPKKAPVYKTAPPSKFNVAAAAAAAAPRAAPAPAGSN